MAAALAMAGLPRLVSGRGAPGEPDSDKQAESSIEALSEAVERSPEDALALSALAQAYLRHGDFEFAEFYFESALESESRSLVPGSRWLSIGDLWALGGRQAQARDAWNAAWNAGVRSPELQRRIERSRREESVEAGNCYLRGNRFEISYDCGIAREEAERVDLLLSHAEDDDARIFGIELDKRPFVVIYLGRRVLRALDTPEWVAGFFDGRIHVPLVSGESISADAAGLLAHELAHAFMAQLSGGRAPGWLQEGIAQYVEGRRTSLEMSAADLPFLATFAALEPDFHQRTDRDRARRAYELSLSFIQFLSYTHGIRAVICLARDLGRGEDPDAAARLELGGSLAELQERWRASIPLSPHRRANRG
ncbi:MAG TPA: hypothetical protein VFL12_01485 [Thermoanaerobaculia bacterium]|nr:hypothetical protein [Thermoanaerobaculia bacterium]